MTLQTGQILNNRYRIVRLLKSGGFGAVYRAWDLNLQRPCAVKENNQTATDSQRQFIHEATILANLHHPNLPRVTDHFILPNQGQYLVMDFIEGKDLGTLLQEAGTPLPFHNAQTWILQVCDALIYMHSQNPPIIHRDIKPENIKITPDGRGILVDFGISKYFDPRLPTTSGARAVTPGYSPPEQYGQGMTDTRTDVYALGATLYTLVTNRVPPDSVDILRDPRHLPPAPVSVNPSVGPGASMVIQKAMQIDPNNRFSSISEFRNSLINSERVVIDRTMQAQVAYIPPVNPPVSSIPSQPQYPAQYPQQQILEPAPMGGQKKRSNWLIYLGAALAFVVIGFFLYTLLKPEENSEKKNVNKEKDPTSTEISAVVIQATNTQLVNSVIQPSETPIQISSPIPTPWNSEIGVLFNSACRNCHNPNEYQAGMDLTTYQGALRGSTNGRVIIPFDPNNSKVILVQESGGHAGQFFPDELDKIRAWIKAGAPENDFSYSAAEAVPPTQPPYPTNTPIPSGGPEWPPPLLAYMRGSVGDSDIYRYEPSTGQSSPLVVRECDNSDPAWSPDGGSIAFQSNCDGNYDIWEINSSGGAPYNLTGSFNFDEREPHYSPDGQQIIFQRVQQGTKTDQDGEIVVLNRNSGNISSLGLQGRHPVYSPDGRMITFMSKMSKTWQVYTYQFDNGNLNQLSYCLVNCRWPDWSSDGSNVIFNLAKDNLSIDPNGIAYITIRSGNQNMLLQNQPAGRPDWSSSGWIAFNTSNKGIEIITPDGKERQFLITDKAAWGPSWSR